MVVYVGEIGEGEATAMRFKTLILVAGLVVLGVGLSGVAQYGGFGGSPPGMGGMGMGGYGPGATVRPVGGANFVQVGGVMVNPENVTFARQTDAGLEVYFVGGPSIVLQGDDAARLMAAIGGGGQQPLSPYPHMQPMPETIQKEAVPADSFLPAEEAKVEQYPPPAVEDGPGNTPKLDR